jgi:hypothetical protein
MKNKHGPGQTFRVFGNPEGLKRYQFSPHLSIVVTKGKKSLKDRKETSMSKTGYV